jgi:ubiquinol-cytochrome c reductase cytochrome c subunit
VTPSRRAIHRPAVRAVLAASLFAVPAIVGLAGSASGRPAAQASTGASPSAGQIAAGRTVYEERCSSCHGAEAEGSTNGPPLRGLGPAWFDFMMSTGRMPLQEPGAQMQRRPPVLRPNEIGAVTDFLTSLQPGGEAIPTVDLGAGNLSTGEKVFQDNCAPCHGATGRGGAVGVVVAPDLYQATPTQVAEAVRIGPDPMPPFGETTIDQNRLNSLVRYVLYLRNPDDRGGSGLSHVGPLIEGFVALTIGLGTIVVVTRYTGTRT